MPSFQFSPIPAQPLEAISKIAESDASRHRPVNEHQIPSALGKVEGAYVKFHNVQRESAQDKLTALQKEIDQNNGKSHPDSFLNDAKNETISFFNFNFEQQKKKISQLDIQFRKRNEALITFMNYRGYTSLPTRADINILKIWVTIGLIFLAEAIINGVLFMSVAGLATALALTTSQSFINIGTSFVTGRWVITSASYHPNIVVKILNFFILSGYIIFILWLNLALGMFRQLNDMAIALGLDVWGADVTFLQQAINPFSHLGDFTVQGAVVALVGICFAGFSAFKGYFSDDPRPGFGTIYRGTRDDQKRIVEAVTELRVSWISETKNTRSQVELKSDEAIRAAHDWSHGLNLIEKILVDWDGLIKSLEEAMRDRIKVYYQSFSTISAQNHAPPQHVLFNEHESQREIVFSDAVQYLVQDSERQKQLDLKERDISEARKNIYSEIDQFSEYGKKLIDEVSSKFPSEPIGNRGEKK
jgi:hypothetical protein